MPRLLFRYSVRVDFPDVFLEINHHLLQHWWRGEDGVATGFPGVFTAPMYRVQEEQLHPRYAALSFVKFLPLEVAEESLDLV